MQRDRFSVTIVCVLAIGFATGETLAQKSKDTLRVAVTENVARLSEYNP